MQQIIYSHQQQKQQEQKQKQEGIIIIIFEHWQVYTKEVVAVDRISGSGNGGVSIVDVVMAAITYNNNNRWVL